VKDREINHATLKAIFTQPPAPEDSRSFIVRLLDSIRVTMSIKRSNAGKTGVSIGIKGGTDF